ncbi:MAG: S8/S53 family peptidase [Phycisphaerae bacterium]|nr:S8/S53 family peptidase [Phycisphaerae bacterium]
MMRRKQRILSAVVLSLGLATMALALELPKIDRKPVAARWQRGKLTALPHYDPNSAKALSVDLRSYDLTGLNLQDRLEDLLHADFDDQTKWPAQMPQDYDYGQIMELGKNPGLGIRDLHRQGITGQGVGIAICDQPLLVDHQEYADRIRLYEEINILPGTKSQMHGPAVASIAVGKTVGVAPEADLYYIAQFNGMSLAGKPSWDFQPLARAIDRILEINQQLPTERKIRVISISVGWHPSQRGYEQITEAVNKAKAAGMLVICSSVEQVHGFRFHGLGRHPLADPNDFTAYGPGVWWARPFNEGHPSHAESNRLLVPMDARTTASPTGVDEYVFYSEGGWSWSIPYIAGVYALAAQVEPQITPDRFWTLAMRTGRTIDLHRAGEERRFGPILDAAALIAALQRGELGDPEVVAAELAKYYPPGELQSRQADAPHVPKDVAARIDKLAVGSAMRQDVIALFGEPLLYCQGKERFDVSNLPSRFAMLYPGNVQVIVSDDCVQSVVVTAPGYLLRGQIQVGASKEDVSKVLEPPLKTMEVASDFDIRKVTENPVFFQNAGGDAGSGYYRNEAEGVGLYFSQGKVMQICLLPRRPPAPITR